MIYTSVKRILEERSYNSSFNYIACSCFFLLISKKAFKGTLYKTLNIYLKYHSFKMKHIHTISFKVNVKKKTIINIFAINLKRSLLHETALCYD